MAVALIVAAGRGERLGAGRPKALVAIAGRPMLQWSVETVRSLAAVDQVVAALPPDELEAAPPGVLGVAGGEVRSQSVLAGLRASGRGGDPVIVHDAARPLAGREVFEHALAELERSDCDAVIAAVPIRDTVKELAGDGRTVGRTIDRARLWAVQTPQVFRRSALERALTEASDEVLRAATDDAWLVERSGGVVRVVESNPENIKVTTPTDLRFAELLLSERSL